MLYWIILFIVSYVMKSLIFSDMTNINHNLNKLYISIFVVSLMMACDSVMFDSKNTLLFGLLATVMVFFIKDQIFIDDDQYLSSLIENYQQSIDMSEKIKDKTVNPQVRDISNKIITNFKTDITLFKNIIKTYRPVFNV